MRSFVSAILACLVVCATQASADSVKSQYTASNGVVVTVYRDDFADRTEYTAPSVDLPNLGGFALVAKVKTAGKAGPAYITGAVYYRGDWRFYNSAIARGGEALDAKFGDRNVGSCSGSRYGGGCSLNEGFRVYPTAEQLAKYTRSGVFEFQLRSSRGGDTVFSVPASYFSAVNEVAAAK